MILRASLQEGQKWGGLDYPDDRAARDVASAERVVASEMNQYGGHMAVSRSMEV